MSFTQREIDYLTTAKLGRLATVQPDGTPQVNPVGFTYNPSRTTIDIGGYNMAASRKFRNVVDNGRVAFVVDDIVSVQPWRVRCLEIRGLGEAIPALADDETDTAIIRVTLGASSVSGSTTPTRTPISFRRASATSPGRPGTDDPGAPCAEQDPTPRSQPPRSQLDADQIRALIQGYMSGTTTYELGAQFGIRPTNGQRQHADMPMGERSGDRPGWASSAPGQGSGSIAPHMIDLRR